MYKLWNIILILLMILSIKPALSSELYRGINIGSTLDAPKEGAWGPVLKEKYFKLIKDAGFDSVRIPIRWSTHADLKPPYIIDKTFFERIDWAINQALSNNLITIINIHNYDEIMKKPLDNKNRFLALWKQISGRYKDYNQNLYFELLNEPFDNLDSSIWNQFIKESVHIIRKTNPQRKIVIGSVGWNNSKDLESLYLPEDDKNLIATFHYYLPFEFTHQGTHWITGSSKWLGTKWKGTNSEKEAIRQDLDKAVKWAFEHKINLWMGEFGSYYKADMDSRIRWTKFLAREAEKRNIPWAYWDLYSEFGIYNISIDKLNKKLLKALIP